MLCSRDELVTDNLKLVYYFFNKLRQTDLVRSYKEDLISEGMVGLVKAANSFDCNKNIMFSTYASRCIQNEMLMFIRKLNKFYDREISLDEPMRMDGEGNELCLADILESKQTPQEDILTALEFKLFLEKQKVRDKQIFTIYCMGYKQNEIAKKTGLSQSYISRIIGKIKTEFKKETA